MAFTRGGAGARARRGATRRASLGPGARAGAGFHLAHDKGRYSHTLHCTIVLTHDDNFAQEVSKKQQLFEKLLHMYVYLVSYQKARSFEAITSILARAVPQSSAYNGI